MLEERLNPDDFLGWGSKQAPKVCRRKIFSIKFCVLRRWIANGNQMTLDADICVCYGNIESQSGTCGGTFSFGPAVRNSFSGEKNVALVTRRDGGGDKDCQQQRRQHEIR